jgi:hypothetical protein
LVRSREHKQSKAEALDVGGLATDHGAHGGTLLLLLWHCYCGLCWRSGGGEWSMWGRALASRPSVGGRPATAHVGRCMAATWRGAGGARQEPGASTRAGAGLGHLRCWSEKPGEPSCFPFSEFI